MMSRDDMIVAALGRLTDALSEEILNLSDAEVGEVFAGRSGRVVADSWRQMVRRVGASVEGNEAPASLLSYRAEIDRDHEKDTP